MTFSLAQTEPAAAVKPAKPCPSPDALAQAMIGAMPERDAERLLAHVQTCAACKMARNELVERLAASAGRLLYKDGLHWLYDHRWVAQHLQCLAPDASGGRSKTRIIDRRFTLAQFARGAQRLRGSTAECGVFSGVASAIICQTLAAAYTGDELHFGFDSFEGLSELDDADRTQFTMWTKGSMAIGQEVAEETLSRFPFCRLVKGWIPATLVAAADRTFRLVHFDLDLHRPTLDALDFFYPRICPGGLMIFDDYGFLSCLGVRSAVDEFFEARPETIFELVTGQAVAFKT